MNLPVITPLNDMPKSKRPLKVFLCHARMDSASVRALYNYLLRDGMDVWLDNEELEAGQDWEYEIRKAIRNSDVVIICLSQQFSRQRGYRQKELRIALDEATLMPEGQIFIIPVRLEECDMPESLRRWQRVDLFKAGGYGKLLRAIRRVRF
jgi:hypothetical protein